MVLRKLTLRQFRAHQESTLNLTPGVNLIHGPNGAGKTNVLEAIHYLAIGRSFVVSKDRYALRFGADFFDLRGSFYPEDRSPFDIRLVFKPDEGKKAFVNGAPLDRLTQLVGRVPIVVLAPGDHILTDGPPEARRRFLDNTLSQSRPAYLTQLLKFRRTIKQRNALLARGRTLQETLLEPWDAEMAAAAAHIVVQRQAFLAEFNDYLLAAYRLMEAIGETPSISHRTFAPLPEGASVDDVRDLLIVRVREARQRELDQRRSLVGPQRDDLIFALNGVEVRRYASQGQHRTFAMALKLAKHLFLRETLGEKPILLLDDAFGDLDRTRTAVFLNLLVESDRLGQSVITTADPTYFKERVPFEGSSAHSRQAIDPGIAITDT